MSDATPAPSGAPRAVFVEGLLDGRVGDGARLSTCVRTLGQAGAGAFRLDVQGGRFSLLPVDTVVTGTQFDDAAQARFLEALHEVVAAAAPGSVETNLRCRMVFADVVAETLFVVRGNTIEPLTRRRPATPADLAGLAAPPQALPLGLRRRELVWLVPVLAVVGVFLLWQGGWIDRVLAARADELSRDTGAFGTWLAFDVDRSWGNYVVMVKRGADYPQSPADVTAAKAAATDLTRASACDIVGDGRDLYVQLLGAEQKVLAESRIDVRPLLGNPAAEIETRLPGMMGATGFRLSVQQAPKSK